MTPDFLSLAPETGPHLNVTDEDLIRELRTHSEPLVRDLARRLGETLDETRLAQSEYEKAKDALERCAALNKDVEDVLDDVLAV